MNCATRALDGTLLVRMHARRVAVEVPAGVRALRVLVPEPAGGSQGHRVSDSEGSTAVDFDGGWGTSAPIATEGRDRVELTLTADHPLSPDEVPSRGLRPWPAVRRSLVEGRDRVQPIRRRRRRPAPEASPANGAPRRPTPILFSVHSGKLGGAERMALLEAERLGSCFRAAAGGAGRPAARPLRRPWRAGRRGGDPAPVGSLTAALVRPARYERCSTRSRMAKLIRRRQVELVLTNSSVSVAPVLAAKLAGVPVIVHARDVPKSRLAPLVLAAQGRLADDRDRDRRRAGAVFPCPF